MVNAFEFASVAKTSTGNTRRPLKAIRRELKKAIWANIEREILSSLGKGIVVENGHYQIDSTDVSLTLRSFFNSTWTGEFQIDKDQADEMVRAYSEMTQESDEDETDAA